MSYGIGRPSDGESNLPISMGPIDECPWSVLRHEDFPAAVAEAFAGVELGAYDQRIIDWMIRMWDQPTMATVVSLVIRARRAGGAS